MDSRPEREAEISQLIGSEVAKEHRILHPHPEALHDLAYAAKPHRISDVVAHQVASPSHLVTIGV
jgi:hypothetical protein